jgi:hypothetical protein
LPKAVKSLSFVDVGGNVTATDVANFESQVKLDAKACCVFNCEFSFATFACNTTDCS